MSILVTAAIVFNTPTDRADWLDRCLASLGAARVSAPVYHFGESAPLRERQYQIAKRHHSGWLLFVDPDDWVTPEFKEFAEYLREGADGADAVWAEENWMEPDGTFYRTGTRSHHPVALRGRALAAWVKQSNAAGRNLQWNLPQRVAALQYPEPVYNWVYDHGANTRGRAA